MDTQLVIPQYEYELLLPKDNSVDNNPAPCKDDLSWSKDDNKCDFYANNQDLCLTDKDENGVSAYDACKFSCDSCSDSVKLIRREPSPTKSIDEPEYSTVIPGSPQQMDESSPLDYRFLYQELEDLKNKIGVGDGTKQSTGLQEGEMCSFSTEEPAESVPAPSEESVNTVDTEAATVDETGETEGTGSLNEPAYASKATDDPCAEGLICDAGMCVKEYSCGRIRDQVNCNNNRNCGWAVDTGTTSYDEPTGKCIEWQKNGYNDRCKPREGLEDSFNSVPSDNAADCEFNEECDSPGGWTYGAGGGFTHDVCYCPSDGNSETKIKWSSPYFLHQMKNYDINRTANHNAADIWNELVNGEKYCNKELSISPFMFERATNQLCQNYVGNKYACENHEGCFYDPINGNCSVTEAEQDDKTEFETLIDQQCSIRDDGICPIDKFCRIIEELYPEKLEGKTCRDIIDEFFKEENILNINIDLGIPREWWFYIKIYIEDDRVISETDTEPVLVQQQQQEEDSRDPPDNGGVCSVLNLLDKIVTDSGYGLEDENDPNPVLFFPDNFDSMVAEINAEQTSVNINCFESFSDSNNQIQYNCNESGWVKGTRQASQQTPFSCSLKNDSSTYIEMNEHKWYRKNQVFKVPGEVCCATHEVNTEIESKPHVNLKIVSYVDEESDLILEDKSSIDNALKWLDEDDNQKYFEGGTIAKRKKILKFLKENYSDDEKDKINRIYRYAFLTHVDAGGSDDNAYKMCDFTVEFSKFFRSVTVDFLVVLILYLIVIHLRFKNPSVSAGRKDFDGLLVIITIILSLHLIWLSSIEFDFKFLKSVLVPNLWPFIFPSYWRYNKGFYYFALSLSILMIIFSILVISKSGDKKKIGMLLLYFGIIAGTSITKFLSDSEEKSNIKLFYDPLTTIFFLLLLICAIFTQFNTQLNIINFKNNIRKNYTTIRNDVNGWQKVAWISAFILIMFIIITRSILDTKNPNSNLWQGIIWNMRTLRYFIIAPIIIIIITNIFTHRTLSEIWSEKLVRSRQIESKNNILKICCGLIAAGFVLALISNIVSFMGTDNLGIHSLSYYTTPTSCPEDKKRIDLENPAIKPGIDDNLTNLKFIKGENYHPVDNDGLPGWSYGLIIGGGVIVLLFIIYLIRR